MRYQWSYVFLVWSHRNIEDVLTSLVFPALNHLLTGCFETTFLMITHKVLNLYLYFMISIPHYIDVIMTTVASQITSLMVVYSTVYSFADQRKHKSSASLAFVWGIHRRPVNSPHKWPVTRKMFPFDDVIMLLGGNMTSSGHRNVAGNYQSKKKKNLTRKISLSLYNQRCRADDQG